MDDLKGAILQQLLQGASPKALQENLESLNPDELKNLWVAADQLQQQLGEIEGAEPCPECGGSGMMEDGEECPECEGGGMAMGKEKTDGYDQPGSLSHEMKKPTDRPGKLGKMKNMIILISAKKKKGNLKPAEE